MTSKIFAQLFDRTYKIFTNDLKCSLKLEPDHFDGCQYSVDEFFELSCGYFDQPEQFYRLFNFPTPGEIKQAGIDEKMRYKNFLFPSPVTTEWTENNTAHLYNYKYHSRLFAGAEPGCHRHCARSPGPAARGICGREEYAG